MIESSTVFKRLFAGILLVFPAILVLAEGSKQMTPDTTDECMLLTNQSGFGFFAEYNSGDSTALFLRITDTSETVYIGLSRKAGGDGQLETIGDYQFRILDPSGNVVHGPFFINNITNNATTWNQATAGPDVLAAGGYSTALPFAIFNPDTVGDFRIEFSDSPTPGQPDPGDAVNVKWYDFTVVDDMSNEVTGRLWSSAWALRTPPISPSNNPPDCQFNRAFNGVLYSYTMDGFVSRIDFDSSGFQGLNFNVSFGLTGPGNSGNLIVDRRSLKDVNATVAAADHMVFVSEPDINEFPSAVDPCGTADLLGFSCLAPDNFCIEVGVTRMGQVEVTLAFSDDTAVIVVAEIFDNADTTCLFWNGLKPDGTPVEFGETVTASIRYAQGVQHYAAFDVELLSSGFCVETVRPICPGLSTERLYWDDINITDNIGTPIDESDPGTGQPVTQLDGCICGTDGCRTWTNFQVGDGTNCTGGPIGYGQNNTLNTWWFASVLEEGPFVLPLALVQIVGDTAVCPGDSTEFVAEVSPDSVDFIYEWSGPNGFSASTPTTGQVADPGIYTLVITDTVANCSATDSIELVALVPPQLTLDFTCVGSGMQIVDIDLTAVGAGPFTYQWSNGDTTEDLINVPPGEYSVIVTDTNLCMSFDTILADGCCELIISCPNSDGGLYSCLDDVPLPDTSLITIVDFCDTVIFTVLDVGNGASGCAGDTLVITRTYTVTDAVGTSMQCTRIFEVVDDVAPELASECPADTAILCNSPIDTVLLGAPEFADYCDGVMLTYLDDSIGFDGTCTANVIGQIERTFYAEDSCGNVDSSCVQVISIIDTIAPSFTVPADTSIACDLSIDPASAGDVTDEADNCTSVMVSFSDQTFTGVCPVVDSTVRTWVVTDACGNSTSAQQVILSIDTIAPLFTTPADITIACDQDSLPITTGEIVDTTDNCLAITVDYTDLVVQDGCPANDTVFRTWIVSDACGNSSTGLQTIVRIDTVAPTFTVPADVTLSCEQDTSTALTGVVTDTADNCSTVSVDFSDSVVPGECPATDTTYRIWVASDVCGNSSTGVQVIVRVDTTAPVITFCPADTTVDCDASIDPADLGEPLAMDNCSPTDALTISFVDDSMGGQCATDPAIRRTWSVEDECGNVTTCIQLITIQDTVAPTVAVCPADTTIECTASADTSLTGVPSYTDNCSLAANISVTYSDDSVGFDGSCLNQVIGTITRTFTAEDDCGNVNTACVQVITVVDTVAPLFTVPADITITCDQDSLPATTGEITDTTDNCTSITVMFTDLVVQDGCPVNDTIFRTWTVSDACGNAATGLQTILRIDTVPPTFTTPADITLMCDQDTSTAITGMVTDTVDNCSNIAVDFTDINVPGECPATDTTYRTWIVSDECGNSNTSVQTIVRIDTVAPVITFCPSDTTVDCDGSLSPDALGIATATDNCTDDGSIAISFIDNIPGGQCSEDSPIIRTWFAEDACGNVATCVQMIITQDTIAPVVDMGTCPTDTVVDCLAASDPGALGIPTYTDNCNAAIILTFSDDSTGFDGNCADNVIGIIERTFIATDSCGNVDSSCVQLISVIDTLPPTFTVPADITIDCLGDTLPSVTGEILDTTDNCVGGITVDFSDVVVEDGCPANDTIFRTWVVTDACGNFAEGVQIILRIDTVPPTFTTPADTTLYCTVPTDTSITGVVTDTLDNCLGNMTIGFTDVVVPGVCPATDTTYRTWTVSDACGNAASSLQVIIRVDTVAPTFTVPADTIIACDSDTSVASTGDVIDLVDSCSMATLSHSDMIVPGTCASNDTIFRTWIATDACGNQSSGIQAIIRVDTVAPALLTCPMDMTFDCETPADTLGLPTYMDNCGAVTITFSDDSTGFVAPSGTGQITRTFFGTDECGNVDSSCVQVITVQDTTAPIIACPIDTTVFCPSDADTSITGVPVFSDNCDSVQYLTLTVVDDSTGFDGVCSEGVIVRTFIVADLEGNAVSCTQVITVADDELPTFTPPADVVLDCDANVDSLGLTGIPSDVMDCNPIADTTYSDINTEPGCSGTGTIVRTWFITDACGNVASATQLIMLIDTTGPVLTAPADITISCEEDPQDTTITGGGYTVTDNCSASFNVTFADEFTAGCGITGTVSRTWSAQDECGNVTTVVQTIEVVDTTPPTALCMDISINFDLGDVTLTPADIDMGSFDNCGDVTLALSQSVFSCTEFADQDAQTVQLIVTDECGNVSNCDFQVFASGGSGIDLICPGPIDVNLTTGLCEAVVNYVIDVEAACGSIDSITIEQIDTSGLTSGDYFPIGVTIQEYIAYSTFGDTAYCSFPVTVHEFPEGPTVTCNDAVNFSVDENCDIFVFPDMVLEGDIYGCFDDFLVEVEGYGSGLGGVLIEDPELGVYFTVTVTNENGVSCWGTLMVEDKVAPVISCLDVTLTCGDDTEPVFQEPVEGVISAIEQPGSSIGPGGGVVTIQTFDIVAPAGALVTDVNVLIDLTHTWSADLDVLLIGPNGTETELATDVCGSANDWSNVFFDDEASILVTAACTGTTPALADTVQPEGSLANQDGQLASGTWTLQITDDAGGDGGNLNVAGIEIAYFLPLPYAPEVADGCGVEELTYTDEEIGEDCDTSYIIRTWVATDASGNSSSCTQTISILPLTLDGLEFPDTYLGSCGESLDPSNTGIPTLNGEPIVGGGQSCNIFITYEDHEISGCGGGIKIQRTWTILDWCTEQIVDSTQLIKLTDDEAPVIECPGDQLVGTDPWHCVASINLIVPPVFDECGSDFTIFPEASAGDLIDLGAGAWKLINIPLGQHTVTWYAEDECGNESNCSYTVIVVDDVPPVPACDEHTVVSLTEDADLEQGLTKIDASVFDDGSFDNCSAVTFAARRMESCIDFDWTTQGAGIDEIPNGIVNAADRGTSFRTKVPFACCDVANGPVMVELRITDESGNINSCMIEVEVQDKLAPFLIAPPEVQVSCDFWFEAHETNGFVEQTEDPLTPVFGRVLDAFEYDESDREDIIIDDPGNDQLPQPYNWGIDGWADDNCAVEITVRVRIYDDCSGDDLPGVTPDHAVKLIERTFLARDAQGNSQTAVQRIWIVDFDPFYIADVTCNNEDPNDGVIWPCDQELDFCPQNGIPVTYPTVFDDNCNLIGIDYNDDVFEFADGACFKIVRTWTVIDWCQYDSQTGTGIWSYTQVIKVNDKEPTFILGCYDEIDPVTFTVFDDNISLPANNQVLIGEDNPLSTSCSIHYTDTFRLSETCSEQVTFDVKFYPNNGHDFIQIQNQRVVEIDTNGFGDAIIDTRTSDVLDIRLNGLPYNDRYCDNGEKDVHRILITVEDGCGNINTCAYLVRFEDRKQPTPVCVGLSSVVMPSSGEVTIWAEDFNASSTDDCTAADDLLYSFSGEEYRPSRSFDCDAIEANGAPTFFVEIWAADEGVDHNCDGVITWDERNKDYCSTFIVINDNDNVCETPSGSVGGIIHTEASEGVEKVNVDLHSAGGEIMDSYVTGSNGQYLFFNPLIHYVIVPERNDNHKNGVSTLDLVRIQRHLLGIEPFDNPYQMIAADANNTQSVSALDLVELRKLILGLYLELPNNKSWRFVDSDFIFTDVTNPWPFDEEIEIEALTLPGENFVGVKIGDVNGSVTANANSEVVETRSNRTVELIAGDVRLEAGETVSVPVAISESSDIYGFQWTFELNGLKLVDINAATLDVSKENVAVYKTAATISWSRAEQVAAKGQLFELQFISERAGTLSEMLSISSRITGAEIYEVSGSGIEISDVRLTFGSIDNATPEFALYQNTPNPFTDETVIGFDLPKASNARLTVYDLQGRVVASLNGDYAKGYNEITIRAGQLDGRGVLYYRLDAGEFSATKKMVRIE